MNELVLFVELAQIEDLERRREKLDEMTAGNPTLRARLEELLEAHVRAENFLPTSHHPGGVGPSTSMMPEVEKAGATIGPYKLLQEIGEGGMGTVFMAEQSTPVQRRVALKIIKAGMDTRQVIARFEAERQALALMDHPNIAKVLDAGATTTGRPYFLMELVKGVPITKYCDDKQLPLRDRLELFIQVCNAIQHAHQKGIIHRDIKPTNVLVAQYDGKPVPKVIDFGVAKATAQKLTEKTMFTEFGMVIGTIEYMSPEQAEVNQLDIDTRSDVYSLGVMLYELLTGSTPLESKKLRSVAHNEMLRMIREEEPSRPSIKLSTSAALPSIAASRGTDPAKLKKHVSGELDWIVMKALEKERARRYGTAMELGKELARYLNDETVLASPPSRAYRFRKFVRKNRALAATAMLIGAALLLGIGGLGVGLYQARVENAKAIEAAEKAGAAEMATVEVLKSITGDAIEKLIGSREEIGPAEKEYLETALLRWKEFAQRQGDDKRSMAIRAEGHYWVAKLLESLGKADEAKKEVQEATSIFSSLVARAPNEPKVQQGLGRAKNLEGNLVSVLGDTQGAIRIMEEVVGIRKSLAALAPRELEYQEELAQSHSNLGNMLVKTRQFAMAENHHQTAIGICTELAAANPASLENSLGLATRQRNLASLYYQSDKHDSA